MNIFEKYNIKAKRSLGQNFLIDNNIVNKIIASADLNKNDVVLEIGPGLGILTKELAKRTKRVIAVEKDNKLCKILEQELKDFKNIKIINADILKNYELRIMNYEYKLIANLPFNIASAVIRKFLEAKNKPKEMILMVQKEVAQRICAKPCPSGRRAPNMSILSVSVQFYAKPKILFYISKNSFSPKPKVDAAMLKLKNIPHNNQNICDKPEISQEFFKIVKAGFSSPRKQLINNLSNGLKLKKEKTAVWLKQNNINPTRRAQTLTIQDWKNLTKNIHNP